MSKEHEVFEVQKSMIAIHESRNKLAKEVMAGVGNGDTPGLNLDLLSAFGWKIIELNKEFEILSARHKELMGY